MVFLGRNAFFQNPFVVIRCYAFHVWHAAIAYFKGVSHSWASPQISPQVRKSAIAD